MKEKYTSFWRHILENSKKLEYFNFTKFLRKNILHQLRHFNERRNLVKFKISNLKLMIEMGRYQVDHVLRGNRLCPLCESKQNSCLNVRNTLPGGRRS